MSSLVLQLLTVGCDACVARVDPRGATLDREQAEPAQPPAVRNRP
jgi:hypothetical protein